MVYSKYMSKTSYTKLNHVYYTIAWSIEENGKRKWYLDPTYCKTPTEAFDDVKDRILLSKRDDFEMRLAGFRFG